MAEPETPTINTMATEIAENVAILEATANALLEIRPDLKDPVFRHLWKRTDELVEQYFDSVFFSDLEPEAHDEET